MHWCCIGGGGVGELGRGGKGGRRGEGGGEGREEERGEEGRDREGKGGREEGREGGSLKLLFATYTKLIIIIIVLKEKKIDIISFASKFLQMWCYAYSIDCKCIQKPLVSNRLYMSTGDH